MINDVDDALRKLIRDDALPGTDVDVVLDAPTRDWAARRSGPTVDVYLYDIREDVTRRSGNQMAVRRDDGKITGYRTPPRVFRLAYLVTAWTQRPEDEHRLLAALLSCFVRHDVLPEEVLSAALVDQGYPVAVSIAQPPPDNRKVPDVWSSLGGDLKPSLDLVVTLTVDLRLFREAAEEVVAPMRVRPVGIGSFPDLVDDDKVGKLPEGFAPAGAAGDGR